MEQSLSEPGLERSPSTCPLTWCSRAEVSFLAASCLCCCGLSLHSPLGVSDCGCLVTSPVLFVPCSCHGTPDLYWALFWLVPPRVLLEFDSVIKHFLLSFQSNEVRASAQSRPFGHVPMSLVSWLGSSSCVLLVTGSFQAYQGHVWAGGPAAPLLEAGHHQPFHTGVREHSQLLSGSADRVSVRKK